MLTMLSKKFFVIFILLLVIVVAVYSEVWSLDRNIEAKPVEYTLICQDSVTGKKNSGGVYTNKEFAIKDLEFIKEKMYAKEGHVFEYYVEEGRVFVYHLEGSNGEKIW